MAREEMQMQKQAMARIHRAVRHYAHHTIKTTLAALATAPSTTYPALFAGYAEEKLPLTNIQKPITLFIFVAAGCFRALDVAAQLTRGSLDQISMIFIVDNSRHVMDFWELMKSLFVLSDNHDELNQLIQKNQSKFAQLGYKNHFSGIGWKWIDGYLDYYLSAFQLELHSLQQVLETLIKTFGFESLKQLVKRVMTVQHDWTLKDCRVFEYIHTRAKRANHSICLYATDIIACVDEEKGDVDQLFSNIQLLNPTISVYRNRRKALFFGCAVLQNTVRHPDRFYVFSGMGNTDELREKMGYIEQREYERFKSSMECIIVDWETGVACLKINEITRAIPYFKKIERMYAALTDNQCTYVERYCRDYILARALGFALLQNNDDSGVVYLEKSAAAIKELYGDCEYMRRYKGEINQVIQLRSAVLHTSLATQTSSTKFP